MKKTNKDIASAMPEVVPEFDGLAGLGTEMTQAENGEFRDVLASNIGTLLELMTDLKSDITNEWQRVKKGEASDQDLKRKIKGDLAALVTLTIQQESRLHDFTSERAGKAGEYALDLGSARAEIGERLSRLRDAKRSAGVPGEP